MRDAASGRRGRLDTRSLKIWRDVWAHKARTLLVVLAITVGLTAAGSVLNTWMLLRRVTRDGYRATNPAAATVRVDHVDSTLLAHVAMLPGIADVQRRRTVMASIRVGNVWRSAPLFVTDDPSTQRIGLVARERGEWPPRDDTFVIEQSSVAFANAEVGDTLEIKLSNGPARALPISGVARDAGLAPGWMEHVVYGFITPATLRQLGGSTDFDQVQFTLRDHSSSRDAIRILANDVKRIAERDGHPVRAIDVPEPGEHIHAAQMESLLLTQEAFGVLCLALSAFLVVNLMSAMLTGQVREIGVMKAIGASNADITRIYLGLALLMGVGATLLSLPLAALVGRAYAEFSGSLLNFDAAAYDIPWPSYVMQAAVGLLLPVLAALIPVRRTVRRSAAAALRDVGLSDETSAQWPDFARFANSRPLLLSLRNTLRRRTRTSITIVTLALGGAVFLAALDVRQSVQESVEFLYGRVIKTDLMLRVETPVNASRLTTLARATDEVALAEAWSSVRASLARGDDLRPSFAITGVPVPSALLDFPMRSGRWLAADEDGSLVVSARLLHDEPSLTVGATVSLRVDGAVSDWRVVGLVDAGPMAVAYASRTSLSGATGDVGSTGLVVRSTSRTTARQSALVQSLRERLEADGMPVASAQLVQGDRQVMEDHLLMVVGFLLVMAELTIVVGGLGLASTMSLAVLERTREIGVMRAIGASPFDIMRIVQVEGLLVSVTGFLVAIPLSLPMSVLLGRAFGRVMFPVPDVLMPSALALGVWLLVSVVVAVVASGWPARHAAAVPAAIALAYE